MNQFAEQYLQGVWTAVVTPFHEDGSLDIEAFDRLLDMQREAGVTGVVLCGTTGESPTTEITEKLSLIKRAKARVGSDLKIMAGVGSSNTKATKELARLAWQAGSDALLVVTPPYNKPNFLGLKKHFQEVADATPLPICLYYIPGRSGLSLNKKEIAELCEIDQVKMVKESSGSIQNFASLQSIDHAMILSGDDLAFLPGLSVGGKGLISVASNIFPKEMVAMYEAYLAGQNEKAIKFNKTLYPFFEALFIETNPCPVKYALSLEGLIKDVVRLPLGPMTEENRSSFSAVFKRTKSDLMNLRELY